MAQKEIAGFLYAISIHKQGPLFGAAFFLKQVTPIFLI
jgi:hypothetical protein